MNDEDGFGASFHAVEDVGLRLEVGHALAGEVVVFAVEDDELRGVEGEADVGFAREAAEVGEIICAVAHHGVELGMVGWVA